jgi:hypothetical protein
MAGMISLFRSLLFIWLLALFVAVPQAAQAFELAWPVACDIGKTCWIQQYPDHDATAGAVDYTCGGQSYDGHDGTDIRVASTRDTANIVASAAGTVKGMRDSMADQLVKSESDRASIAGIECGNGVVIDHGGGWETQYCHMKRGSVVVQKGETVEQGQKLGEVGYSGDAGFPHVHLSVRKDGKKIDPFSGEMGKPCDAGDTSLWSASARNASAYQSSAILELGFANAAVDVKNLETGTQTQADASTDAPALVAYAWVINLKKGDTLKVVLSGPDSIIAENQEQLDRNKAQYLLFAGKKKPPNGWPPGTYQARVTVGTTDDARAEETREIIIQ